LAPRDHVVSDCFCLNLKKEKCSTVAGYGWWLLAGWWPADSTVA
jgi:hypothetical protein